MELGAHCCLSQGVYLCTGNHDWGRDTFDLITAPISVESGAWVAAFARIGPGVRIAENAVVGMGSVVASDVPPATVWAGNPAVQIGERPSSSS